WRRVREAARGGGPVGRQAAEGIAGAVAGLLLFIPGYLTGVLGALLLIPPIRRFGAGRVQAMTEKRVPSHVAGDLFGPRQVRVQRTPRPSPGASPGSQSRTQTQTDEVIEGEIVD
ncbi:MAG: FxsA family protein, partial [Hamadaea sp.]|nr:FxsA family protein [Hamadaea sp.]